MRNPKLQAIKPNYLKRVLEITLQEGRKLTSYNLPFAAFRGKRISSRNRFVSIVIDQQLGRQPPLRRFFASWKRIEPPDSWFSSSDSQSWRATASHSV